MPPPGLRLVDTLVRKDIAGQEPGSVVLIGSYPPRRCGIATFTADVHEALVAARPNLQCDVFAMTDAGGPYDYPPEVALEIREQAPGDYHAAAAHLAELQPDVIFVQHEFGIFGGPAGEYLMLLLGATDRPVVSMLHTVLEAPNEDQRRVFERLIARSSRLVVMAERGRDILRETWNVPDEKICLIAHGAPDRALSATEPFKEKLGLGGKQLLFTFGLLSPNKGIEVAIRALPAILKACPDVVYAVLGATHPHLVAHEGEAYRESLVDLARKLGVEQHVRLIDEYTDTSRLVDYLQATDVYLTPYLNPVQITSGTLSYAAAVGCAVVSTPYWHAEELLADGNGRLVPFGDSGAISAEVLDLLADDARRQAQREKIYAGSRETIWSAFAERALRTLGEAMARPHRGVAPGVLDRTARARVSLEGVRRLTDSCGILQHSLFAVPDRRHGYCVDDNARALLLMHKLPWTTDAERRRTMAGVYAAFIQHAWNADEGCFRNFMSYERQWLEPRGSEDSCARAFWSVAATIASPDPALRRWAEALAGQAWPHMAALSSPRSIAFVLLGLAPLIERSWGGGALVAFARQRLERLEALIGARRSRGQDWFEDTLAYDNARLPEAMIRAGMALNHGPAVDAGLQALDWLCRRQTSTQGLFLPVATADFGQSLTARTLFDQQPLEASATLDACEAAYRATRDSHWVNEGERAFAWYFGANIPGVPLAGPDGECFDGLTWEGPNENRGAESVLSLQLAICTHQRLTAAAAGGLKTAGDL